MKKLLLLCLLMICSCGLWSCKDSEVEVLDGEIVFELYDDDDKLVNDDILSFGFDETRRYTLKSLFASYVEVTSPAGWSCEAKPGVNECRIIAPPLENTEAAASGKILFNIKSQTGRIFDLELDVIAVENDIIFTFDDENITTEQQLFPYGKTVTYSFTTSNVASLDITAPAGWTATHNDGESFIMVTTPTEAGAGIDQSGYITVTPKSVRGTNGVPSRIDVKLDAAMPSMIFEQATYNYDFAGQDDITFAASNITELTIESQPEGWTISADLDNKKLSVKAPAVADSETAKGIGKVVLKAVNENAGDPLTQNFEITVRLKGIATAEDFMAFCTAYNAGNSIDSYLVGGEVLFVGDIDLSNQTNSVFINKIGDGFDKAVNGWNRTITLAINTADKEIGLFHTLAAAASVKNLNMAGSITSTYATAEDGLTIGGVAAFNDGASFNNVTTDIDFTYNPASWQNRGSTRYGGLVGYSKKASYTDCRSTGDIYMQTGVTKTAGGLVGFTNEDGVSFTDCTNSGNITILASGEEGNPSGTYFGGTMGNSMDNETVYTRCVNDGTITINVKAGNQVAGVGGIAGTSYGTFTDCVNNGAINAPSETKNARRYGGIAGVCGSGTSGVSGVKNILLTGCENYGNITHASDFAGGIVGIIENGASSKVIDCHNYGNIANNNMSSYSDQLSGLLGTFYGDLVEGCTNRGTVSGTARYRAGGLIGRGRHGKAGKAVVKDCTNYGEIKIVAYGTANYPVIGGLVAIDDNSVQMYEFENCKNEGRITAQVTKLGSTNNIWFYQKTVGGSTDTTVADESTAAEQAKTDLIDETLKQ